MRSLSYAIACGALLVGTSAQAQNVGIVGDGSAVIQQGAVEAPMGLGQGMLALNGRGGSAEAIVEVTASHASFESGVAVSGKQSSAVSYSGLDVTLTNGSTESSISIENFGSTIIPAGMGFYLADRDGMAIDNNIFTGFGQTDSGLSFGNLFAQVGNNNVFASAAFDFSIVSDDQTLYSLSGSLDLKFVGGVLMTDYGLTDAEGVLHGFTTAYNTNFAQAYAWDATDIVVPLNALLLPGQSKVLQYRTSVSAYTNVDCVTTNTACLVAYSGFGDPIGRGGGIASFAARGAEAQGLNPITGIVFDPQDIEPFRGIASAPVPEPATWISMLLGFGLLGGALRRRRVLSYS
jgi:hypothetical protein